MKEVPGFEGKLAVTKDGKVWDFEFGRFRKQTICDRGYYIINVRSTLYYIHRLVAITYLPLTSERTAINHINGIKTDNRISNLEWVTPAENNVHAIKTGLRKYKQRRGESVIGTKLTWPAVNEIRKLREEGHTLKGIGGKFGVSHKTIWNIVTYRQWRT